MDTLQWVHDGEEYTDQVTRESSGLALSLDGISVSAVHLDTVYHPNISLLLLLSPLLFCVCVRWKKKENMSALLAALVALSEQVYS